MVKTPEQWRGRTDCTVPFGLRDGRLWFVMDVETGLDCRCKCPDPNCDKPLIARNRPSPERKRAYNFMHSTRTASCGGRESALHRMAKQLLLEAESLLLPDWDDGNLKFPAVNLNLDAGALEEVQILDGQLRPDTRLSGHLQGVKLSCLYVEVKVSHAVDCAKAAIARRNRICMMEIDVSGATDQQVADYDSFRAMVLGNTDNRSWISLGDPKFLSAVLGQDIYEVLSCEPEIRELPSKKGNYFQVTKQHAIVYRTGEEPRKTEFEIADTFQGTQRIDGLGNELPYQPGLYVLAQTRPPAYSYGAAQFFKTFLTPIDIARRERQSKLFA